MADLYADGAAAMLSAANAQGDDEDARNAFDELASELVSLANQADG